MCETPLLVNILLVVMAVAASAFLGVAMAMFVNRAVSFVRQLVIKRQEARGAAEQAQQPEL